MLQFIVDGSVLVVLANTGGQKMANELPGVVNFLGERYG